MPAAGQQEARRPASSQSTTSTLTRVDHTHASTTNTHRHIHTHKHTNTHTHTSTTKVFGGMSSSSNGVDRRGFVVAPASQYSALTLLPVRAQHRSEGGEGPERWQQDETTQQGCDRSRWCPAERHKTSFLVFTKGGLACSQGIRRRASRYDSNNNEPCCLPLARRRQSGR